MPADATATRPAPLPLDYRGGDIMSRWTPLLYGVLWAFALARLLVAYRPARLRPLWALAVIWVLINYGLLSVAPVCYLQDMWRQGENVSDGP